MISVTDRAKEKVLELIRIENRPDGSFIRVGVEGGGCSR
jgi:iron-sulfur cluster assembly protein